MMLFFDENYQAESQTRNLLLPIAMFVLLVLAGVAAALHALIVGHDHVFGTSREVPWGILVTPYVFFACLSTGICIISSLGQVFRIKPFIPLVNRSVFLAIVTMASGLMAIGLEIENPWNMAIYGFLSPNPISNIWWKSAIYTLYIVCMSLNFLFLLMNKQTVARIMAIVALFVITCGNLNMNSDMALIGARGFWAENYMPLFFLTVSMLSACSVLVVLQALTNWVHKRTYSSVEEDTVTALFKLMVVLVIGLFAFSFMKILGGFSEKFTDNPEAMKLLVIGDFSKNFWIGEVFLASVIPLVLLALSGWGKRFWLFALAGLSCAAGISVIYYDLIVVGQLVPHFHNYNLFGYPEFYSYSPTLNEFVILAGSISLFLAAFLVGEWFFNSNKPFRLRA